MKANFISIMMFLFFMGTSYSTITAQCYAPSEYVNSKNAGLYGGYNLISDFEERAAQTYFYDGSGTLSKVRVYGAAVPFTSLRVVLYNVDVNGRPTTVRFSKTGTWRFIDQFAGYKDFSFSDISPSITNDFAVAVELAGAFGFQVAYTGDGEGLSEDLASLAGTSTGFNWSSAMTNFSKNGDFRIVPYLNNDLIADFSPDNVCLSVAQSVSFTNNSIVEKGGMFNVINKTGYSGANTNYTWDFGDASPTSSAMNPTHSYSSAGVYTVSLTVKYEDYSGNVCSNTKTYQISVGLDVSTSNIVNASCFGSEDGSVMANASGGAGPYEYKLEGGDWQAGANFTGLTAGSYTLYVRDELGCSDMTTFTITQPTAVLFTTASTTNASCGNATGAILLSATGGSGSIQYAINGGTAQSSGSFSGLLAGSYTCVATDNNGCEAEMELVVNDQGGPGIVLQTYTNISCNGGNDGSIVILGSGGVGSLQYSIDGISFQSSGVFGNLPAGNYTPTVRDAAGCVSGFSVTLTEPNGLSLVANQKTRVSCHGGNDGVIEVLTSIGGIGNHSYSINGINFQTSKIFTGIYAGTYTVTVRDAANCISTTTVIVSEPDVLAAINTTANLSCNNSEDGSIDVNVTGGVLPYQYRISGATTWQFGDVYYNLPAGTYTITVRDGNGCTTTTSATLTQPTAVTATFVVGAATCGSSNGNIGATGTGGSGAGYQYSIDQGANWNSTGNFTGLPGGNHVILVQDGTGCTSGFNVAVGNTSGPVISNVSSGNVTCFNGNDGSITIQASGGTGTLEYSIGDVYQTGNVFTGLPAGEYYITVRDAVGCFATSFIVLTQGSQIAVNATVTGNVSCAGGNDGSVSITAAGGIGTIAYSLDGAAYQSTGVFTGLSANVFYIAYVRDAGGCISTTSFNISEPAQITGDLGYLNVSCYGQGDASIFVNASGGSGALQYSLDGGTFGSASSWMSLQPGVHNVVVRDANNCTLPLSATITQPDSFTVAANISNVSCAGGNDGVIDLSVSGASGHYAFVWSNSASVEDLFNLQAGTYSVLIMDDNGCNTSKTYVVTEPANPLTINGTVTNASGAGVNDGGIDITVTGGSAPYTYSWSNGATTEDLSGVAPNFYIVIITDAGGCETPGIFSVSMRTGVEQTENTDAIVRLFPNPARDYVNIEVEGFDNNIIQSVRVVDVVGRVVYSNQTQSDKLQLDTREYVSGMYLIQIEVDGQFISQKLNVIK